MRKRLLIAPSLLLGMVLLMAAGTAAATPHLSVSRIYGEDNFLCIDFYLKNAIDRDLLGSMRNGVATLLRYRVDVWLDRANWYDKLVNTVAFSYRINYDNWDTLYCVDANREAAAERITVGDVAQLIHLVCNQQRMKVCPISLLDSISPYYVTISAEVTALSAERVREIDSWLGGGEEKESSGGVLGFVIGLFKSGSKTAETKSDVFSLRGLSG
jgi:hypothetical protein